MEFAKDEGFEIEDDDTLELTALSNEIGAMLWSIINRK